MNLFPGLLRQNNLRSSSFAVALLVFLLLAFSRFSVAQPPMMKPSQPDDASFAIRGDIPITAYPDANYDQPRRPSYHFTSKRNWLNDPNGLVHDGEKYHLFFQHNPLGNQWGNMTWGHAVSKDMLRWTQQPHALVPYAVDGLNGTIYSGTAIIDHMDSLGRESGDTPTLAAFFTFAAEPKFHQALASSTDRGQTWTLHNNGRAVVPNQGLHPKERDPKVFWHGPTERWGMVLWVDQEEDTKIGTLRFFLSDDMVNWQFACDVKRPWAYECPDVFFAPVDNKGKPKTILYDASGDYEVGVFDGKTFRSQTGPLNFGEGGNHYASQIFNNQPQFRNIQMSWMRDAPAPAEAQVPFCGQMSFPVQLRLVSTKDGPRLAAKPIAEISTLVTGEDRFDNVRFGDASVLLPFESVVETDVDISIQLSDAKTVKMRFGGLDIDYQVDGGLLRLLTASEPVVLMKNLSPVDGALDLRIMIDRMSVEVFADEGKRWTARYAMPDLNPSPPSFSSSGGEAIASGVIRKIMSVWNEPTTTGH